MATLKDKFDREQSAKFLDATTRRFAKPEHLWPNVSNRIALGIVHTAHQMLPGDTYFGPAIDDPEKTPPEIYEYQMWLHGRLAHSGLDKAIAGGPALLPDITGHLPQPWRYLAQRSGPKNYRQLTRLIVRNLDWFLDQARVLRDAWTISYEKLPLSIVFTVLVLASWALTTPLMGLHWLLFILVFILVWGFSFAAQMIWGRDTYMHKTNCAEFFHYIAANYADVDEAKPEIQALTKEQDAAEQTYRALIKRTRIFHS